MKSNRKAIEGRSSALCSPSSLMPETEAMASMRRATSEWVALSNQLERERDHNRKLYETECKDMAGLMKTLERVIKERDDAAELLAEIMRDEVNHQDEAEKWLRAYAPHLLFSENVKGQTTPTAPKP